MEELAQALDGILSALPPGGNLVVLAVIAGLFWLLYRKRGGPLKGPRKNAPSSETARLRGDKRAEKPASKPSGGRVDHQVEDRESPGQNGLGATVDLESSYIRKLQPAYAPKPNGAPNPGEVVWTWVPYAENNGEGKDRPVLIIANISHSAWAGCYLSTKQHKGFVSVGSGAWDSQGRESFLNPERVLRVTQSGMRRESAAVTRENFERAVAAVKRYHGG